MSGHHDPRSISGSDLRITVLTDAPTVTVLRVDGTLDATTASELDRRLNDILDPLPRTFLLDLGQVDYLSSMGLSVILRTAIRLKNAGADCLIYDPRPSVRRVLEISKWAHLILDPASVTEDRPYSAYLRAEEPSRAARRAAPASAAPPRLYPDRA